MCQRSQIVLINLKTRSFVIITAEIPNVSIGVLNKYGAYMVEAFEYCVGKWGAFWVKIRLRTTALGNLMT